MNRLNAFVQLGKALKRIVGADASALLEGRNLEPHQCEKLQDHDCMLSRSF